MNSNLNFELQETPFRLNLNLKKSFAKHWNKPPHHVSDEPVHQPQQPSFTQPGHIQEHPDRQTPNNLFNFNNVSQHHHTGPPVPHVDHHLPQQDRQHLSNTQEGFKILDQIKVIQSEHDRILEEDSKEYAELDKSFRKLSKVNKELQTKHLKVCSDVNVLKNENGETVKENNALSVALKSSRKDLEVNLKHSDKEIKELREELSTLNEYKIQQQEDKRKVKKLEKKLRQKDKKEQSKAKEVTENEHTKTLSNNNQVPEMMIHPCPQSLHSTKNSHVSNSTAVDMLSINNTTLHPSMVTHWFPPTSETASTGDFSSSISHMVSLSAKNFALPEVLSTSSPNISNFKCELCGYLSGSEKTFKAHVKLEKYMEEFYDEARNMLENVPDDEQILTWREISHLSLDCQQIETIYKIVREAY